jgi:hypothetical protein
VAINAPSLTDLAFGIHACDTSTTLDWSSQKTKGRKTYFLKKRSKKLLLVRARRTRRNGPHTPRSKSFLVLFFKK